MTQKELDPILGGLAKAQRGLLDSVERVIVDLANEYSAQHAVEKAAAQVGNSEMEMAATERQSDIENEVFDYLWLVFSLDLPRLKRLLALSPAGYDLDAFRDCVNDSF